MVRRAKKSPTKPTRIQRVAAEKERVERARAETDAMFSSIGQGVIVTDSDGNVYRVNQAALDILHIKEKDILGKWYPGVVLAEEEDGSVIDPIDRPITQMFMTGKPVFRKMYFVRPDNSRVPVALTISPVVMNNKPIGAVEIFRDITEEVRLDRAKDEFISLASHQLRTPATGVKQYLAMVLDGYVGKITDAQRRFIETANASNDRQLRIIDDILKVAAADAGNVVLAKEEADLVTLTKSVIADHASKFASKKQILSLKTSSPHIKALLDIDSFRMVLENLLDNAHKYTYNGKHIGVSILEKGNMIYLSVSDEGTGISRQDIPKLFQKFSRLKNPLSVSSGGTGLGLYWVRQILDLHNADIKVRSKPEEGTTFTILLPRLES